MRRRVDGVMGGIWRTDPRDGFFVCYQFLAASCEQVSISIAAVLAERGLGRWTFVRQPKG